MNQASDLLFLYVDTPLHAGIGFDPDAPVDLPIQRDKATGYPIIFSSTLKGAFRALARDKGVAEAAETAVFGPPPELVAEADTQKQEGKAAAFPAALSIGDAQLLLFPVRSLFGVFAWATSAEVFARFLRTAHRVGVAQEIPQIPAPPPGMAWVAPESPLITEKKEMVLEEFTFRVREQRAMSHLGQWLADTAFPLDESFDYWIEKMASHFVILPDDAFQFFVTTRTMITHRIRINPQTGTVEEGALWSEEYVPPDSLFYTPVEARPPYKPVQGLETAEDVLTWLHDLLGQIVQVGSGRTLGRGLLRVRWASEVEKEEEAT